MNKTIYIRAVDALLWEQARRRARALSPDSSISKVIVECLREWLEKTNDVWVPPDEPEKTFRRS